MQRPDEDDGAVSKSGQDTVELLEEVARVEKIETVTGRVRISSVTELVEATGTETLITDRVRVERVPVDRIVSEVPLTRLEGDATIIPIFEEVLVVEKRLLLKEELHIRRESVTQEVDYAVPLRKQRAVIERDDAEPLPETKA